MSEKDNDNMQYDSNKKQEKKKKVKWPKIKNDNKK